MYFYDEEPRKIGFIPTLIEIIGLLLLQDVVALDAKAL